MRTSIPPLLPLFRSEMQVRLLALVLLQPERSWTLHALSQALDAPQSSVHRELSRAQAAGVVRRDDTARPYRFSAATDDAAYAPLAELLRRSVGVEGELRAVLDRPDVHAAVIYGSWASGARRPDSDIDVLVIGDADQSELRRRLRPIGKATGRTIDLTVLRDEEFRRLLTERSSFARSVREAPVSAIVGDLETIATP
jgi:predicted nucleotidyltransferase